MFIETDLPQRLDAGASPTFANLTLTGATLTGGATGLNLAAGGTNQNITLTPSGTGSVNVACTSGTFQVTITSGVYARFIRSGVSNWCFSSSGGSFEIQDSTGGVTPFKVEPTALTNALVLKGTTGNALFGSSTDVTTSGNIQSVKPALATTSTVGIGIRNETAATGGATVQMSPSLRFRGHAWDTAASQTVDFFIENLPASAATPTGTLKFGYSLNGAAATYPMTLTSAGALTVTGGITSGGGQSIVSASDMVAAGGSSFLFASSSRINSPSNGVLRFSNNAISDFNRINLGGDTSSFPALARGTTMLQAVLADGSDFTAFVAKRFYLDGTSLSWSSGSGTPEGAVSAAVGSIFSRTDGGATTSFYVKESGAGNTGWVAK